MTRRGSLMPAGTVRLRSFLLVMAVVLPLFWLLDPHLQFRSWEWANHHWMVSYQAEHWRQHHEPAEVFNTATLAGMPYPVFYGYLFYPALGLLASFVGTDWSLRVMSLILTALPFALCFRLFRRVTQDWWVAWLVASINAWAIYTLTNLYCRAALTEFAAVAFLTCALCQLLQASREENPTNRNWRLMEAGLFYTLAAGSHPITALFGGIFLGLTALGAAWQRRDWKSFIGAGLGVGIPFAAVLGPWLYAVLRFRGDLMVDRMNTRLISLLFSPTTDSLAIRLSPLPYEAGVQDPRNSPFPFIETQVALALLLLAIYLTIRLLRHKRSLDGDPLPRRARVVSYAALALFFVLLFLSVWPTPWQIIPRFFWIIQFAYRLVAYMNLALLVCIFAAVVALREEVFGTELRRRSWLIALLGLASVSLVVKLAHVGTIRVANRVDVSQSTLLQLPKTFYGYYAYAAGVSTSRPIPGEADLRLALLPGTNDRFGVVPSARFSVGIPSTVFVPVQPFPWNWILLNDALPPPAQSVAFSDGLVVKLEPGNYEVAYRWRPEPLWTWWKKASWFLLVSWTCLIVGRWLRIGALLGVGPRQRLYP